MSEVAEIIDSVEGRIQKLFEKMNSLQVYTCQLETELKKAVTTIDTQSREIEQLKGEAKSLKMANSLLGSEENKRDTKLKINSLVKEIDYCISQLSD
jgi:cell shape-determining protein MreC